MYEVKVSDEDFQEIAAKTATMIVNEATRKQLSRTDIEGIILGSLRLYRAERHHIL